MIKVYLEDESGHWELLKEFTREIQAASYINKFLDDRNMKHRVVVKEQDEQYVHYSIIPYNIVFHLKLDDYEDDFKVRLNIVVQNIFDFYLDHINYIDFQEARWKIVGTDKLAQDKEQIVYYYLTSDSYVLGS